MFKLLLDFAYRTTTKLEILAKRNKNNLVPRVLSYPPYGARERDPGKRWSRVFQNLFDSFSGNSLVYLIVLFRQKFP